ncbi:MAG TPA: hypothetical protein VF955_06005 [Pyrinomonadaceae bacterium]
MSISRFLENVRKAQDRHKVLAYFVNLVLSLVMLGGFWILIKHGTDNDRYFWIGIGMVIIGGLAMLPTILPRE